MSAKQETVADIVRELRGNYYKMGRSNARLDKDLMALLASVADRIEAANRRDVLAAKVGCESFSDHGSKIWEQEYRSEVCVSRRLEAENAKMKRTVAILFRDIGLDECGDCVKCADDLDFSCPYAGDPDGCNNRDCGRIKRLLTKEKVIGGEE